jgi:hypothetical protein
MEIYTIRQLYTSTRASRITLLQVQPTHPSPTFDHVNECSQACSVNARSSSGDAWLTIYMANNSMPPHERVKPLRALGPYVWRVEGSGITADILAIKMK